MFHGMPPLLTFGQTSVACSVDSTVQAVLLQCHHQGCDRIVVLDAQSSPLGLVYLYQLIPGLLEQESRSRPLRSVLPAYLEPLPTLAITQAWSQTIAQLQAGTQPFWAVIDDQGRFQGLIDRGQLLREYTCRRMPPDLHAPLSRDRGMASDWRTSSQALSILMEVLDHLPLPLLLQQTETDVLHENTQWKRFFQEIEPEPGGRTALIQGMMAWLGGEGAAPGALWQPPVAERSRIRSLELLEPIDREWGTDQGCLCRCLLHNGQERMLRFIRLVLPMSEELLVPSQESRLATLEALQPVTPSQPGILASQAAIASYMATLEKQRLHTAILQQSPQWSLLLAQDVTEQHQLARELTAKNADLIQLNRLKDEFLACISHELRTPLTAIMGLSSLLKDQTIGDLNDRQRRYIGLIHRSGKQLMQIVNDILDLTRMEAGQLELIWQPVKIAEICQRAFEQAQQVRWQNLSGSEEGGGCLRDPDPLDAPLFSLEVEAGLETLVADPSRLKQMLVHLLSNALKFTEGVGQVGLRVARWEGWIAFTVWDTGIGIPADKQHLIFQKFQQLENPLTRQFEGTGLGLFLTQRLARLHGGDVTFTSREHQGSQFTLLLPPAPPFGQSLQGQMAAPIAPVIHANRLVLVVEVSVRNLEDIIEQLTNLDYRVVIARSGTDALEKARQLQPCAILLNPFLPLLSGWDVLTLIKADPQTQSIPVIVTASQSEQHQAFQNRADGFLGLPINHRSLAQTLDRLTQDAPVPAAGPPETAALPSRAILCLSPSARYELGEAIDWSHLLHVQNYRVIEANDIEQAELLARVWQPQVVLLSGPIVNPLAYLKELSQHTYLASLPLITLDPSTTQAANQFAELTVFPCLIDLSPPDLSPQAVPSATIQAILQVIEVAIGFAGRPLVLAIDGMMLTPAETLAIPIGSDWLQAMVQYIQSGGLRGLLVDQTAEIFRKRRAQTVDLVLIYWHGSLPVQALQAGLERLHDVMPETPILLVDHHTRSSQEPTENKDATLRSLTPNVYCTPPHLGMDELLRQIQQILGLRG